MSKYIQGVVLLVLSACVAPVDRAPDGTLNLDLHASACAGEAGRGGFHEQLTVMTRNIYVGADFAPLLSATSLDQIPGLVAQAWAQVQVNNFPERAQALAAEIAAAGPALIGVQEVTQFRLQSASQPEVVVDYLTILLGALKARGLDYRAAAVQVDSSYTMPLLAGFDPATGTPIIDGLVFTDRDVILARADVATTNPTVSRFAAALPISLGGIDAEVIRGWASVEVAGEHPFRFITTHLEEGFVPAIQAAQAAELLSIIQASNTPVVFVGDINSAADGSLTPTYATFTSAGLIDTWSQAHPHDAGYTCCQPADLHQSQPLDQRIDTIFVANPGDDHERLRGPVFAQRLGADANSRTPSGLWPSDHAGVSATFRIPQAED